MSSYKATAVGQPTQASPESDVSELSESAELDMGSFDPHHLRQQTSHEPAHGQARSAVRAGSPVAAAVRRMLNRSGNSLFTAIEPLLEAEFFASGSNGISVAWTVGHLACVFDLFTSWIHLEGCLLPKEVHGTFNSLDVKPAGGPSKAEIVMNSGYRKGDILFMLRSTQIRALKLLGTCTAEGWGAAPPGPHPDNLHSVGEIWEHLAVHTYWHMGELCGTFPRFHGTYTLNMLPHYFYFVPAENDGE